MENSKEDLRLKEILRLKEVLKEKGITGKTLSDKVGVTPTSISHIVKGNHFPKPELLLSIADALDVDVRELFTPSTALNGFVEYSGTIYRIQSIKDLENLLLKVKSK